MEEKKICSFFGHREIANDETLYERTREAIFDALEAGCKTFYFGGYGEFDELCYSIVSQIKRNCPNAGIERVYCVSQERYLWKKVRYFNREDYDEVIYLEPSFTGWYKSIYFRNCAMINESAVVIFYAEERAESGAYKAYKYARKKKDKQIINLWQKEEKTEE